MEDNQQNDRIIKEKSLLNTLKGTLLKAFVTQLQFTPMGMALGLNTTIKTSVNDAVKDIVRDAWFATTLGYHAATKGTEGSTYLANKHADDFEQWYRKNISQRNGQGHSEFRMAVGWKLPEGTLYNGKPVPYGTEVSAMDAVYLQSKDGKKVEVLDHEDPRYADLVLPYLALQIVIPSAAGKAVSALKAINLESKAISFAANAANVTGKVASVANTGLMMGFAGVKAYEGLALTPRAIQEFSHILDDSKNFGPDRLRDKINKIYDKYSYQNGFLNEQFGIERLKGNESPYKRASDLSRGIVTNVYELKHPFDRTPTKQEKVELGEVRDKLAMDINFRRSFFVMAQKALNHGKLTDPELFALGIGMNVIYQQGADLTAKASITDKGIKFSAALQAEMLVQLRSNLSVDLVKAEFERKYAGKEFPEIEFTKAKRNAEDNPFTDPAKLLPVVNAEILKADTIIKARQESKVSEDLSFTQNQLQAMAMMP